MISYEMAKELQKAGLKWNPEVGDLFYYAEGTKYDSLSKHDEKASPYTGEVYGFADEILDFIEEGEFVFVPSLSQMLKEIKALGYLYLLLFVPHAYLTDYLCCITKDGSSWGQNIVDSSTEKAVARALLWALEKEVYHAGD
jgi:hypothetical protein